MGVTRRNGRASWLAKTSMSVNGKRAEKSFADKKYGGSSNAKREAEIWLTKIEADILRGQFIDPHRNKISLEEFKLQVGIVKLNQRETTKQILDDIWESYIAGYPIAEKSIGAITPQDIANHIKNLKKPTGESYSRSTITKVVEVFRVLFRKAIEMEYTLKNPATTDIVKDWIPKKEKTPIHYLSAFEVNSIFTDMQQHSPTYAVIIPLMAYTGLRSGEARGLKWEDIDFSNSTVSITRQFSDRLNDFAPPKNEQSIRTIKIPQYVMKYLKEHKKNSDPTCELLFPNQKGNQNGSVIDCNNVINGRNLRRRHLKPALERLEMSKDINLHTFRHTSVKLARESGADLHAISKRLGHSKINTTSDTYSELFENIDTELVDNLDEYIFKQLG